MTKPSLTDYVKHAEKFGTLAIFETAEGAGLSPHDLGCLALHLRRIDKHWRLDPDQRTRLVQALFEANVADKEIRDMAGVSQDTICRLRKGRGLAEQAGENGSTMRREVRKLTWDKQHPHQTISAYFQTEERLSWPPVVKTRGGNHPHPADRSRGAETHAEATLAQGRGRHARLARWDPNAGVGVPTGAQPLDRVQPPASRSRPRTVGRACHAPTGRTGCGATDGVSVPNGRGGGRATASQAATGLRPALSRSPDPLQRRLTSTSQLRRTRRLPGRSGAKPSCPRIAPPPKSRMSKGPAA